MSTFLKSSEVKLINGGYLSGKDDAPVDNYEFVDAQKEAEYICTFADMAKGKNFKGVKADSLIDVKAQVTEFLNKKDLVIYAEKPEEVARPVTSSLAKEALAFMEYGETMTKVEKVNQFMQKFNTLNDFEKHGLFFSSGIVKLNKIYTVQEIKDAVMNVIDLM